VPTQKKPVQKTLTKKSSGEKAPTQKEAKRPSTTEAKAADTPRLAQAPRVRRSPDEARALILDAATELLGQRGPDGVGLKDVARKAGVSHALVTHYFGTIDGLIDAALESHAERQRNVLIAEILGRPDAGPREWLERWFVWVNRPAPARLLAWSFMTGRIAQRDFFSRRTRGAKRVGDAIEARLASEPGALALPREDLDFAILLIMAATHGYAIGKEGYWPALGVDEVGDEQDRFFFDRLADLALGMLARARDRAPEATSLASRQL